MLLFFYDFYVIILKMTPHKKNKKIIIGKYFQNEKYSYKVGDVFIIHINKFAKAKN
jgi:hypothetical protein